MKCKISLLLSIILLLNIFFAISAFALENNSNVKVVDISKEELLNTQLEITNDINNSIEKLEIKNEEYNKLDKKIESTVLKEEKKVVVDLRNDLDAIKRSFEEPVLIYKEVVVKESKVSQDALKELGISTQSVVTYKTVVDTEAFTMNGDTTTITGKSAMYKKTNVEIDYQIFTGYNLKYSYVSFDSTGYGHVSRIEQHIRQRGVDLNNDMRNVIYANKNLNFSTNQSSGSNYYSCSWNSTYSHLPYSGSGGPVGNKYTVYMTWFVGNGYEHNTFYGQACVGSFY